MRIMPVARSLYASDAKPLWSPSRSTVTVSFVVTSEPSFQIHQFVGASPAPQAACFAQPMYTALSRNVRSPPLAMPCIYPPHLPTTTPPITRTSAAAASRSHQLLELDGHLPARVVA